MGLYLPIRSSVFSFLRSASQISEKSMKPKRSKHLLGAELSAKNSEERSSPVLIRVGYKWASRGEKDVLWSFVRERIKVCVDSINSQQRKRHLPEIPVRYSRMRAMHGGDLLSVFLKRCKESDILLSDITGNAPNVLFELGIALGSKGVTGNVFVLQEVDADEKPVDDFPTDLSGYFFTRYLRDPRRGIALVDSNGFRAALLSRIKDAARAKELLRDATGASDEGADDESGSNYDSVTTCCEDLAIKSSFKRRGRLAGLLDV